MTESDLNNYIRNSLIWGYKIPDPPQSAVHFSAKRPFDGFGVLTPDSKQISGIPVYWEAKLLKGFQALPFDRVAEHQFKALKQIKDVMSTQVAALILVGIYIPYQGVQLFSFDIDCFESLKARATGKSISKAEFQELFASDWHLTSHKERFNFVGELLTKTMTTENCPLNRGT